MTAHAARAVNELPLTGPGRRRLEGKRVLFVLPSLGMGGAERQAFLLGRQLARDEGALVRLVSVGPPNIPSTMVESIEREGLNWERFTFTHTYGERLRQAWDLARFVVFLRRERPDVVLSYCMFPNIVSALTWKLGGARACIWNQRDEGRGRVVRAVERVAVGQVGRFLSNSTHGADFLIDTLGVPREQVHVIRNGIETRQPHRDRSAWRRDLGLSDSDFVACMVANLHGFKDHHTLIAAWRRVVDRLSPSGRNAHLLLAGANGDRTDDVRRQIDDLTLNRHVHLLGQVTDVPGLLGAVDLSVFSSVAEGVPNAVLEAMAAGVAVVATDYPGIREALGPSGESMLAREKDPVDLAEKIVRTADDAPLRASLGLQGRLRVASEFSIERMSDAATTVIVRELTSAR
jgi:glycosyltransferase involved in cell wall biosynthesis